MPAPPSGPACPRPRRSSATSSTGSWRPPVPRAEAPGAHRWTRLSDTELLQVRFCDLGLRLRGTRLELRLNRVHEEMARRGLRFRPHMWLAEEWFSPDGVPGIAVPFYLAHPRLI